jgi:RimJ/RimL family protein N-acetyltransferase
MKFTLRPWVIDDLESLVENANNYHIAQFMTDEFPFPYSLKEGVHYINVIANSMANTDFAIEINHLAVGGIGIHPQKGIMKKNAELGYWLGEKYWGHGIITHAIKEMVDFAFDTYNITRIYARPLERIPPPKGCWKKPGLSLKLN